MNTKQNSESQLYQKGLEFFYKGQFKDGMPLLIESAKLDYIPAIKELGLCFLHGISVKQNLEKAIIYFKKSVQHPESQFELCKLYFFGYGLDKDSSKAKKLLIKSANSRYTPALNLMAMCYQINGEIEMAQSLLSLSLGQQDPFAMHLKKQSLLVDALAYKEAINCFEWPQLNSASTNKNTIHKAPEIFTIENLLSDIECEYIKFISSPYMRESMIINPQTGIREKDSIRTSYSATIDWLTEDPAVFFLMQKCCQCFQVDVSQSEILHVLHYSIGEEYKPHYDFFGGVSQLTKFNPNTQRIKTICLYLNDVEQGGSTTFPKLNKTVSPKKGRAVFFENINTESNKPYIDSLHAGEPVEQGEKWLATLWIRNNNTNRGPHYESI